MHMLHFHGVAESLKWTLVTKLIYRDGMSIESVKSEKFKAVSYSSFKDVKNTIRCIYWVLKTLNLYILFRRHIYFHQTFI